MIAHTEYCESVVFSNAFCCRNMIFQIDNLMSADAIIDKLENRNPGDSGSFGTWFDSDSD